MAISFLWLFVVVVLASLLFTGLLVKGLQRYAILDHPNERSSHTMPTPRGGGLAVMATVLGAGLASFFFIVKPTPFPPYIIVGLAVLAAVFWLEDVKGVPHLVRLGLQGGVTALMLWLMGAGQPESGFLVFQGLLPPALDFVAAWLLWVWFVNAFNFMDGIDGISAAESIVIGLGCVVVAMIASVGEAIVLPGIIAAGAMAGFLFWNRPPAKIFLGDVGSVPLGFLFGWMLLSLAADGLWAPALILPLYYLADATLTLLRRILRGEKFWHAHRDHFYQAAVIRGLSHGRVSLMVFGIGFILVGLAVASLSWPLLALLAAGAMVGIFLLVLRGPGQQGA